jgi:hypothetical protein
MTPSEMDVTQLPTATDARLDFSTDSLSLNMGALIRFGNPFLVDVVASTILAVAVAEAVRGRRGRRGAGNSIDAFEPPPPSSVLAQKKEMSDAQAFKQSFAEGFNAFKAGGGGEKGKKTKKWGLLKSSTTSSSTSTTTSHMDKDIELGEWYGQKSQITTKNNKSKDKRKAKGEKEEDGLPFVTRTIINILTFAFKTVVFVLRIAIKVVAGVVVMVTRNISRL